MIELNTPDVTHQPDYKITINGKDKTELFQEKLIQLTLHDKRGFEADQLEISLDDSKGDLSLPPEGTEIKIALGFKQKLIDKGTFVIDEVSHEGAPDTLIIVARSGNFNSLKTQKIRVWENVSIDDVIKTIATSHKLKSGVSTALTSKIIKHDSQTNESDIHFLTRLAKTYDAIACVKNGFLLFLRAGDSKTASGTVLETIAIDRDEGDTHHYSAAERTGKYTGVKANWYDDDLAKAQCELAGDEGTVKTLRKVYSNQSEAAQAADSEYRRISRSASGMRVSLAIGNPTIIPESPIKLSGWKSEIIAINWISQSVIHQLDEQGLTTQFELESA